MYAFVCACALYLCVCVCVCVCCACACAGVCARSQDILQEWYIQLCVVYVHEVKVYHRSGTFNCVLCMCTKSRYTTGVVHSTVILVWQFDKHRLIKQIGKGLPKHVLLKIKCVRVCVCVCVCMCVCMSVYQQYY